MKISVAAPGALRGAIGLLASLALASYCQCALPPEYAPPTNAIVEYFRPLVTPAWYVALAASVISIGITAVLVRRRHGRKLMNVQIVCGAFLAVFLGIYTFIQMAPQDSVTVLGTFLIGMIPGGLVVTSGILERRWSDQQKVAG